MGDRLLHQEWLFLCNSKKLIFFEKFDFFKFLSGYYMRGKFAGIFENRIRNLQATLKETSAQPQSERDSNRRRQWGQVAERGQVRFLWV